MHYKPLQKTLLADDLTQPQIDSAFQLTEHLKALHYAHTHPSHLPAITLPITAPVALLLTTPPSSTDRALWLYELCRFLVQKANLIVTSLFADQPPCSATTCPEMRASEWQYLCAVHDPPKACCAIDYCCHTLDWAANVLTNPKHFPSRLALGTENTPQQHQVRQLTNVFRRVYRIFAHAWFSHREMFWRVEGQTGLYTFFKTVCDAYNLLPEDGYTIPAEAENRDQEESFTGRTVDEPEPRPTAPAPPTILKRPSPPQTSEPEAGTQMPIFTQLAEPANQTQTPAPLNTVLAANTTSRRHRHTPSVGASPVETVIEENEEDESELGIESTEESAEDTAEEQAGESQSIHQRPWRKGPPSPLQPSQAFSPFSQDPNPTPRLSSASGFFPVLSGDEVAAARTEREVDDDISNASDPPAVGHEAAPTIPHEPSEPRLDAQLPSTITTEGTGQLEHPAEHTEEPSSESADIIPDEAPEERQAATADDGETDAARAAQEGENEEAVAEGTEMAGEPAAAAAAADGGAAGVSVDD